MDAEKIDPNVEIARMSVLPIYDLPPLHVAAFPSFKPLSVEKVRKIILSSPSKSGALDPVTMWLLKELCDPLAPAIAKIVNLSLQTGHQPSSMKKARHEEGDT